MGLIGYKYLRVYRGDLISPIRQTPWFTGWNVSDLAPDLDNEKGIYAYKNIQAPMVGDVVSDKIIEARLAITIGYFSLQATVELAGTVIEHELGYRAQYARMLEIVEFYNYDGIEYFMDNLKATGITLQKQARTQIALWNINGMVIKFGL